LSKRDDVEQTISVRSATSVDTYVGSHIRVRRITLGLTVQQWGVRIGVSFQEVSNYERGKDKVSTSKLYQIAMVLGETVLGEPVDFFFGDRRVEEKRGAACTVRLSSPLIKPDARFSRIRLSDWLHGRLMTLRPIGVIGAKFQAGWASGKLTATADENGKRRNDRDEAAATPQDAIEACPQRLAPPFAGVGPIFLRHRCMVS